MTIWERWNRLPPEIREPIKSAIVAIGISLQTVFWTLLGAAIEAGQADSPKDTLHYFCGHWWGVALGIVGAAAYRARQGHTAAQNTVNLPNGGKAVLIPPKGS